MDFGQIRTRLASLLPQVKTSESGKINFLNIEETGRMVKMLCAPYKDPQDPLTFLEPIQTDFLILNGDLASGANALTPVLTKLEENAEMVPAIYGEVTPTFEAPEKVSDTQGITGHEYWYKNIQAAGCLVPDVMGKVAFN